jgi:hypothetical protein
MVRGSNVVLGASSFKNALNVLSMKCDPPLLITCMVFQCEEILFMEYSSCMFGISSSTWHCFYPLGYVVDGEQDVLIVLGHLEWSHEVNTPHIKYFYLKIVVEGHCIASYDVPLKLALLTPSNEFLSVLIHHRPEESTLLDLDLCAEYSVVASIWHRVTFLDDLQSFYCWYTPSQ